MVGHGDIVGPTGYSQSSRRLGYSQSSRPFVYIYTKGRLKLESARFLLGDGRIGTCQRVGWKRTSWPSTHYTYNENRLLNFNNEKSANLLDSVFCNNCAASIPVLL